MIPLISHVPESAPTKRRIKIAPVIDLIFEEMDSSIDLNKTPFLTPTIVATEAPISKINWFDPPIAESPYSVTLYANKIIKTINGINDCFNDIVFEFIFKILWIFIFANI